jgi:hypothetical protein
MKLHPGLHLQLEGEHPAAGAAQGQVAGQTGAAQIVQFTCKGGSNNELFTFLPVL